MLVDRKESQESHVAGPGSAWAKAVARGARHLDSLPVRLYRHRQAAEFSPQLLPRGVVPRLREMAPDIVHFHWTCFGFVPVTAVPRMAKSVVWSLHDMWAFTGGCHYAADCRRYAERCGSCPGLGSRRNLDLSRLIWRRKHRAWRDVHITAITPSRWMADCARRSSLLAGADVRVIPLGLDTDVFRPFPKRLARDRLGLAPDARVILFGAINAAGDPRKGYAELAAALEEMAGNGQNSGCTLVVFGASEPPPGPKPSFPTRFLGHLYDDLTLAPVYSAADVMVVPSRTEAFGQTATEAMACGTPVVAFGSSGLLDIVEHRRTGYLAKPYDASDLASGIGFVLDARSSERKGDRLSVAARERAVRLFGLEKVAGQVKALYEDLLDGRLATPT